MAARLVVIDGIGSQVLQVRKRVRELPARQCLAMLRIGDGAVFAITRLRDSTIPTSPPRITSHKGRRAPAGARQHTEAPICPEPQTAEVRARWRWSGPTAAASRRYSTR